jgi:cytochrome c-type biogenesis protein CcmH/NrfG
VRLSWWRANPDARFFTQREIEALGYELLDQDHGADALVLFELSAEAYPNSVSAFITLGDIYMQLEDKSRAVAAYEKALALNPDNSASIAQLRKARAD